jgi:DNA (cytosine-5)-methyltransferase 1
MYRVLDLFSGCGGLSEGFIKAGFDVKVSIEIDEKACETQRKNHPDTIILQKDLTKFSPQDLVNETGIDEFDIIIGGPPCQGFSLIGTRLGTSKKLSEFGEDPRNKLYKEFVRFVRHFQPKIFLMENVPGLYSMQKGVIKKEIENDFFIDDPEGKFKGYNVQSAIIRAVEFGVPQNRERVIFIGVRKDFNIEFNFPKPLYKENEFFTVRDAIGDLPALNIKDGKHETYHNPSVNKYLKILNVNDKSLRDNNYKKDYIYNHVTRFHNDRDRTIFKMLKPFQKLKELEQEKLDIRLRKGFEDFYRKMDYDKPSPTIIAHLHKDGLAFIHPDSEQARSISVREAARLQSFPDDFVFSGPQTAMFKQIGNAVPPLLAFHLAVNINNIMEKIQEINIEEFVNV